MSKTTTLSMSDLLGVSVTDDGEHLLLGFEGPQGEVAFALPHAIFSDVILSLFQGYGELHDKREELGLNVPGGQAQITPIFVESFEIGRTDEGEWTLFLNMLEGPKVYFLLPVGMVEEMQEILAVALSSGQIATTSSSVH